MTTMVNENAFRGKALTAPLSQDYTYSSSTAIQSYTRNRNGDESLKIGGPGTAATNSRMGTQEPDGAVVLESYRKDVLNGFEGEKPQHNPMNVSRPQSSTLVNVKDPIQIHLLVETALSDSKEFEILSQEEVDDLKKQCQAITQRIEQTRQNLAIQSKYRDAAIAMVKINSPDLQEGSKSRRSTLRSNRSSVTQMQAVDQERVASERKCEELAIELFSLEKRLMIPQGKLLKHTAGILQMTHKGPKNGTKGQGGVPLGMPESPESIFTYSNTRESIEPINVELFDERSIYREMSGLGENLEGLALPSQAHIEMINEIEKRFDELNNKLRQVIIKTNPNRENSLSIPLGSNGGDSAEALQSHLNYLEQAFVAIDQEFTQLVDQKDVLQRQIKQQRELNSKSDATKDAELNQKLEELAQMALLLSKAEDDADSIREQLFLTTAKLEEVKQAENLASEARLNEASTALREAQAELSQRSQQVAELEEQLQEVSQRNKRETQEVGRRNERIAELEEQLQEVSQRSKRIAELEEQLKEVNQQSQQISELKIQLKNMEEDSAITKVNLQGRAAELEGQIAVLNEQLTVASAAKVKFEDVVKGKDKLLEAKEKEIDDMSMDVARLQTEVTIVKAELDGAYGSRAQRAAQVAANPAIQKEIDNLTKSNAMLVSEIESLKKSVPRSPAPNDENKIQELKKELTETIEEYEQMTKASIEWEKERELLETTIDKLRDERENLEAQLSDEKVRWLGMKSPGLDGPGMSNNTSTTVLKNEFKKMMRDTRTEHTKALRVEQTERRRVEDELRALKRSLGPGKSSLSQSLSP